MSGEVHARKNKKNLKNRNQKKSLLHQLEKKEYESEKLNLENEMTEEVEEPICVQKRAYECYTVTGPSIRPSATGKGQVICRLVLFVLVLVSAGIGAWWLYSDPSPLDAIDASEFGENAVMPDFQGVQFPDNLVHSFGGLWVSVSGFMTKSEVKEEEEVAGGEEEEEFDTLVETRSEFETQIERPPIDDVIEVVEEPGFVQEEVRVGQGPET